jgi:four helix bundle protein
MRNDKDNLIVNETLKFSKSIIEFSEYLDANKKFTISKQLLRAGTSIGANVWEAQNAESKNDFIHKLKIAIKEADETLYWFTLCEIAESYPNPSDIMKDDLSRIIRILSKIISSSKK